LGIGVKVKKTAYLEFVSNKFFTLRNFIFIFFEKIFQNLLQKKVSLFGG